jgi:hypothetical protein
VTVSEPSQSCKDYGQTQDTVCVEGRGMSDPEGPHWSSLIHNRKSLDSLN